MTRIKGYPRGTAARIGEVVIMKWSRRWWSAGTRKGETVWATSALKAYRLATRPCAAN
jgi:hypothetical protein